MIATHATKNRVRYQYYVSQPHLRGGAKLPAGSVSRVPATDVEAAVTKALAAHLQKQNGTMPNSGAMDRVAVAANVARIEVRKNQLAVALKSPAEDQDQGDDASRIAFDRSCADNLLLLIPWCKPPSKKFREILLPASVARHEVRTIKGERRAALIKAIARGRAWLDELVSGRATSIEEIAERNTWSVRQVNMTISMAFVAPTLVKAAIEARLPRGIGVANLRDAPAEWSRQLERLGMTRPG
jgi:hypothetical protein